MNAQRLRNITTGRIHTKIGHVYEDLELITGEKGLMTHMLPRVNQAILPWLRDKVSDQRYWDGNYDPSHEGEVELPTPTKEERDAMFVRYQEMPNPLLGKQVVVLDTSKPTTVTP